MKYSSQKEIINAALEALDTSYIGIGIKEDYSISENKDGYNFSLKFQLKEVNETDYFWLGRVSNQYY
ncbi:hypothetical protein ACTS9C_05305 [Empedobacter brevis]